MDNNMMKRYDYKNLKIDELTHRNLVQLAKREGVGLKVTVDFMVNFFIKNNVRFTDKIDTGLVESINELKKDTYVNLDKVIRVVRAQEKGFFEPILRQVNKINSFLEEKLIIDTESKEIEPKQNRYSYSENEDSFKESYVINRLIEIIEGLIDTNMMVAKPAQSGEKNWIKNFTEAEIRKIKEEINSIR